MHEAGVWRARPHGRLRRGRAGRVARPAREAAQVADKHGLEFTLLADEDHAVAEQYGVWVEKSMYVIDHDGDVASVLRKVKPGEHDDRVLAELAA
jgi:thioredoxin-dependent peroxiredoxin